MAGEYDFKRTSAQIETLLDKIPAEGNVSKVYNTTLDVFGIQDGSVVTPEQNDEVINIMDKWMKGYVVTFINKQNMYHYGILTICSNDDNTRITLSVINDVGDLLAFSFDATSMPGIPWTVTNKTSGGDIAGDSKIYQSTLYLWSILHGASVTTTELNEIRNIIAKYKDGYVVTIAIEDKNLDKGRYCPLSVSNYGDKASLSVIDENGDLISYVLNGLNNGGGIWTVTNKTNFIRYKRNLGPTANASTKSINFYMSSVTNECWYILVLNFDAFINGSTYQCRASVPIYVPDTADPIFYSQACMDCSGGPILVEISVGASGVNVKLKTSYTITSFTATYGNTYLIKIQA